MKAARIRLIVAAVLMAGWLGYLGYLALGRSKPIVVSRAQLLYSTSFVKGQVAVDSANQPVVDVEVQESFGPNPVVERTIEIVNLAEVKLPDGKPLSRGSYFLPLVPVGPGRYRVASSMIGDAQPRATAYPWTSAVEKQVRDFVPARP